MTSRDGGAPTAVSDRAVLTIAVGKPFYVDMAVNLARSFALWNDASIRFAIATDQPQLIPPDLQNVELIVLRPGQYGRAFSPKLHIDRLAPAKHTIFLDADTLCVAPLGPVFDRLQGRAVTVIGTTISTGHFFGDVESVCARFGVPGIPWFVGGLYSLERGECSSTVFETARRLEGVYDDIGLVRLRGAPNEEPLIAIAMAMHGQSVVADDGSIKAEPMFFPDRVDVDVFAGRASLTRGPGAPDAPFSGLTHARPRVVHFHGHWATKLPYTREVVRLRRVMQSGWPRAAATAYAVATTSVPQRSTELAKDALRPIYRALLGVRPVAKTPRED